MRRDAVDTLGVEEGVSSYYCFAYHGYTYYGYTFHGYTYYGYTHLGVEEEVEEGAVVDAPRAHVVQRRIVIRVLRAPLQVE